MAFIWDMVMLVGLVGIGYYIMQNPDAIKNVLGGLKLDGAGSTGGGASGGGIGGGNASAAKGAFMFSGTGKTWEAKDSGKTTRNYASGKPSTGTTQWDISGVGTVTDIETDLWVNVGDCADSVSTKVYGGSHSEGNCCWVILNVDCASGGFELGGEGPHPTTESTNLGTGSSMGSIKSKEVGIKLVITKSGSQFTATGYGNTGAGWKSYITKTFTEFGASEKASSPASGATIQFRTDCSGVKYSVARAQEIKAGAGAAAPATGGGAAASTGAGAEAEAEAEAPDPEENEDEENEDEEEDSNSNYAMVYYAGRPYYYNPQLQEMNPMTPMHRVKKLRDPRFRLS